MSFLSSFCKKFKGDNMSNDNKISWLQPSFKGYENPYKPDPNFPRPDKVIPMSPDIFRAGSTNQNTTQNSSSPQANTNSTANQATNNSKK